jgi:hypothetical protein
LPDPSWWKRANIPLDYALKNDRIDLVVAKDIRRREELMEKEDKRRRDRQAALVKRIQELEALAIVEKTPKKP